MANQTEKKMEHEMETMEPVGGHIGGCKGVTGGLFRYNGNENGSYYFGIQDFWFRV